MEAARHVERRTAPQEQRAFIGYLLHVAERWDAAGQPELAQTARQAARAVAGSASRVGSVSSTLREHRLTLGLGK